MEATIDARSAARAMILSAGRPRLGSEIKKEQAPKPTKRNRLAIPVVLFLLAIALFIPRGHKINGWAVRKGAHIGNANIAFISEPDGKEYRFRTDSKGEFQLLLPTGTYSAVMMEKKGLNKSPAVFKLDSESNLRVEFYDMK